MTSFMIPSAPRIEIDDNAIVPTEVDAWLRTRGWNGAGTRYDNEPLFQHNFTGPYYTWTEAVSYEFYRFMNLGADKPNG